MRLVRAIRGDGLAFSADSECADWRAQPFTFGPDAEQVALLAQLEDQGLAQREGESLVVPWPDIYTLLAAPDAAATAALLELPAIEAWKPVLASRNTLTDAQFSVVITGWMTPEGQAVREEMRLAGALLESGTRRALLAPAVWETVEAVRIFYNRPTSDRIPDANRRGWGHIRSRALTAGAVLDNFLSHTVVLTPERLRLRLRKGADVGDALVEVIPGFEDEPERWLETFDRLPAVRAHYEIPGGVGLTHVVVSEEVQRVLAEIKAMPGRRASGERARAFVRNPYALLGPEAIAVVPPEDFEEALADAGIGFVRFREHLTLNASADLEVALLIEETLGDTVRSEVLPFTDAEHLKSFVSKLEGCLARGAPCVVWEGYELELLGDASERLEALRSALEQWRALQRFSAAEIFDLSQYSERIEGFGIEKPYYSPFIAKERDKDGWFPESVHYGLHWTPEDGSEPVFLGMDRAAVEAFERKIDQARVTGQTAVVPPGCPKPISLAQAQAALNTLKQAMADVSARRFEPDPDKKRVPGGNGTERRGLVVKANVTQLDYEDRRTALDAAGQAARLPGALLPGTELKDHQRRGVAWLQALWAQSPTHCRGALLADDMGLGKTLQLLTFMAELIETEPGLDPMLVVAPVALLDNWREEIDKFFRPGTFPLVTLYGQALAMQRVSRSDLDAQIIAGGVTNLLRAGWLGKSRVVLTTYETLRDFELALARQTWSVMVCDEAQKIKNPGALVSRSAKKQNARFKIACTGTPVENSLVDLWNLFDFLQAGLLGALNEFGTLYRRPIEAKTEAQKARVGELRALIEPQTLRRTKLEVAQDLPRKFQNPHRLPLSHFQRAHYARALDAYRARTSDGAALETSRHLQLLQYLRRLCSDPRAPGEVTSAGQPLHQTIQRSPKMAWLIQTLEAISRAGEKAIVFCEFRDLQRLLQRVIRERFDLTADIVNGDTSTRSDSDHSRHRRITAFQTRPGFGAIILSPLAVGFGLNIQAANHVIHFTRHWNPAKEDQATDRAYRIGQTRDVHVHLPMVVADDFKTFDAKLHELLEWKRELSQDMLNGAGPVAASDFADIEAPGGAPVIEDRALTITDVQALDGYAFELMCVALWEKRGFHVIHTPKSGDGGVDIVAIRDGDGSGQLLQCKTSERAEATLGWAAIQEVVGGTAAWVARFPGIRFTRVVVTCRRFNGNAREQARVNRVHLIEEDAFAALLADHPISRFDLERRLLEAARGPSGGLDGGAD
jgi:Holliday junction resolvase